MATLNISLPANTEVCNGKQITFRAPCSCEGVTHISIEGTTYQLVDSMNRDISKCEAYTEGSMISVILDTENTKAYVQNSASNSVFLGPITISRSEWFNPMEGIYVYECMDIALKVTDNPIIDIVADTSDSDAREEMLSSWSHVYRADVQGPGIPGVEDGWLTLYASEEPLTDFRIQIQVVR